MHSPPRHFFILASSFCILALEFYFLLACCSISSVELLKNLGSHELAGSRSRLERCLVLLIYLGTPHRLKNWLYAHIALWTLGVALLALGWLAERGRLGEGLPRKIL